MIAGRPAPSGSRFAAMGRGEAATVLAALPVLMLLSLAGGSPYDRGIFFGDVTGDYYAAAAAAMRVAGVSAPSAWSLPPPAAPLLLSLLPAFGRGVLLLLLAAVVALASYRVLTAAVTARGARRSLAVLLALAASLLAWNGGTDRPATWAALLAAASLSAQLRSRWPEAAALGLAAGVVGPAALPFLTASFLFAAASGSRAALLAWVLALGLTGVVLGVHFWTVLHMMPTSQAAIVEPGNPLAELGNGVGMPARLGGPAAAAALWGFASRREAASGAFLLALLGAGAAAAAMPSVFACTSAVPLLAGLAFVPGGLADAWRAASRPVRRVTVTRVVR